MDVQTKPYVFSDTQIFTDKEYCRRSAQTRRPKRDTLQHQRVYPARSEQQVLIFFAGMR